MSIEFTPLTEETLPAVAELLLPFWDRNWNQDLCDRIFRWRFIERPDGEALLAMDGDRCISMVDSSLRPYLFDTQIVQFRELADWYSLEDNRGVGVQPMWMMMRRPESMVGMGGTDDTRSILPRMKWKTMPQEVKYFVLRLSSTALLGPLVNGFAVFDKKRWISLAQQLSFPIGRVCEQAPPTDDADVQILDVDELPDTIRPAARDYALARLVSKDELRWLQSTPPEMGEFSALLFSLKRQPVGISVIRLFSQGHCQAGRILHVQATVASAELYAWIVSETAANLQRRGAEVISCRTSCLKMAEGLRKTGFTQSSALHPRWWSRHFDVPSGNVQLSWLRGDDGLIPYPEN